MNTETTGTEKDAPDLTEQDLDRLARQFDRTGDLHFDSIRSLLSMARRTAEAEERLKAAEGELGRLKAIERERYQSAAMGTVWPSKRKSKGYGSAGCTCQLIEIFGIEIDPNCPVHGENKQ